MRIIILLLFLKPASILAIEEEEDEELVRITKRAETIEFYWGQLQQYAQEAIEAPQMRACLLGWIQEGKRGSKTALFNLGCCHAEGVANVVPVDSAAAVFFYQEAIARGYVDACYNLGVLYYNGTLIRKNHGEARRLWGIGARVGDEDCKNALKRLGIPKSF